jgi:formylglycine-generating enzyme required for sulfatase activity
VRTWLVALSLLALGPAFLFVACFPDYRVIGSVTSSDGSAPVDGTSGDVAQQPDGANANDAGGGDGGNPADGFVADGNTPIDAVTPFDASNAVDIPAGTFVFHDPGQTNATTVTLTHDYYMDVEEMTAGKLRAFVNAALPAPCASGFCTLDPGGPYATTIVWDASWNANVSSTLYKDDTNCQTLVNFVSGKATYNMTDDALPANCINWYQAAALCWWDGQKRLPTQVEWQYEATGRGRNSTYPWGDTPVPTDCTHAIFNPGGASPYNACNFPQDAGSAPSGASLDGVQDMAGSLFEWTWDWYTSTYPASWPNDYAGLGPDAGGYGKMMRGGSWETDEPDLHTTELRLVDVTINAVAAYNDVGVRCVKTKL